ncbi:MAG TPA: hypothetical protein VGU27_06100, partial [Candidatus Eisenbacteria bacterium]|nr:hypothetical protein [Candidatus Eisenbacteria bacterium]
MSMRLRPLALAAALAAAVAAPAAAQVVPITSTISTNQSWGPTGSVVGTTFWIKNSVGINPGVTLTVQPGVVVKFNSGAYLTVAGTLRAIGTVVDTIVFTSIRDDNNRAGDTNSDGTATSPAPSDWGAIQFPSGGPNNSRLHLCDIRYGGSGQTGALQFQSASDSVTSCVIRRSYFGVDCQGTSAPVLQNTSIEASTQTPIVLDFTATPVFSSLVFSSSDNGFDAIGLRGGTLTGTAVLPQRGATVGVNPASNVTYVLLGGLSIPSGSSLTVNPGVVIKPVGGVGITVGGNLTMVGSPATGDTITVTSLHDDNFGVPGDTESNGSILSPNRGDWNRIVFQPGATGSIQYCRLKFGTNSNTQGVVEMTGLSIGVSNCLITDAAHAVAMFGTSAPTLANLQINNCSSTPTLMSVTANPTFTNLSFLANGITALGIQGEDVSVDARLPVRTVAGFANITYYLMNGMLHMVSPATLRIDPGVVIKSQLSGGGMQIDGALVANGKPDSVIVFTSERDNIFGNPADTNGDGSSTQPGQGDWTYVHFTATTNDAASRINWCRFQYGSFGPFDGYPNTLWITSAAPPVTNTLIFKSSYGMRIDGNSTPLVDSVTFDNCSLAPIVMSALSDPQITTHNTYSTNGYNALALLAETVSQNATLKYRPGVGNAACPTFAYLPTGTITVASGVTLAIQPQVVLKPTSSFVLFGVNGALNIVGSDNGTGRVFITSRRDDALGGDATPTDGGLPGDGDWGDIEFYDTSVDAQCVVRNAKFQFGAGGGNTAGVLSTFSASPTFANLEFFQNRTAFTFNGPSQPGLDSLNIFNCTQLPIVASLVSNPSYGAHITFANDSYLCLGILGETIAQNVRTR